MVLELKFVFSPLPNHFVLFFGHVHCRAEIAFVNKLGSVHKKPAAKWGSCRFKGAHEPGGDILEWDIPRYLWEDFLPKSWSSWQEIYSFNTWEVGTFYFLHRRLSLLPQDSVVLVQYCLGGGVFLESSSLFSLSKLLCLSFQCSAGFIPQAGWTSTNFLLPVSICPVIFSKASLSANVLVNKG